MEYSGKNNMNSNQLRKIDALVAEHVMGWANIDVPDAKIPSLVIGVRYDMHGGVPAHWEVPSYSTNLAAAWEVVEKLTEEGYEFWVSGDGRVELYDQDDNQFHAGYSTRRTAPLAICLAALKAKGVEVPPCPEK
jgi:hypothetical protein